MNQPSIRRRLLLWVLGALSLSAPVLVLAAYLMTLREIDDVLDDSLRQTALLLADRDLATGASTQPSGPPIAYADTESMLVAIARSPDGTLLFTSQPAVSLAFEAAPGLSVQDANDARWHVFTVVQADRIVQVAQPVAARRELAAESASQLLLPLFVLIAMIGGLLTVALRRGMRPLSVANDALAQRGATSLAPLEVRDVPVEVLPFVRTLNDLLERLKTAFDAQAHFVAEAAHELRSPITALQLQVQLLERSTDPAEIAEFTAELSAGIGRARRLIEQLLYISRVAAEDDAGELSAREPVNLGDVVRAVVVRWSREADARRIDLGADVHEDVTIEGDAAQLEILLSNLVENALRYTQPGGVVDVVTGRLDGVPVLRVIDNGPGVPLEQQVRIFDRFYRSPEAEASAETGSGLGLAIVRSIVERHGGAVALHPGIGGRGLEIRVVFASSSGRRIEAPKGTRR